MGYSGLGALDAAITVAIATLTSQKATARGTDRSVSRWRFDVDNMVTVVSWLAIRARRVGSRLQGGRGDPHHAGIDSVGIDGQHLVIEFSSGGGVFGDSVEVAYVLP